MGNLFGTDGVRGIANQHPITIDLAMKIGCCAAHLFKNTHRHPKIVIGKDTRISGYMLENAIASGICSMGVDVLLVGPLPTPGIAFIVSSMRADAGIVISASHNPYEYNGIKIFSGDGFKLPDDLELSIERMILEGELDALARPSATEIGRARRIDDAQGRYVVFLKGCFPRDLKLEGLRVVIDCAHGAAYKVAPAVFEELGAEVIITGNEPNGKNINESCGSLHPDHMAMLVRAYHADFGFALDGDADRVIFADEKGEILDGDFLMAICASHLLKHDRLNHKTLVTTVMSNVGLEIALRHCGGKLIRTAVGDRYVVEQMCRGHYNFGGEQSGHLIFLDHNTTGDGTLSALQVAAVMLREGRPLSELKRIMQRYPQKMVNVKVRERKPLESIPELVSLRAHFEEQLGEDGRIVIRPSGTEPVIRVMVEGVDPAVIDHMANELAAQIQRHLAS
jgi:phosphoglucosamine mutase